MFATCEARNVLCSLAAWTVVTLLLAVALRPGDPTSTSYLRPRFAEPHVDYLEVSKSSSVKNTLLLAGGIDCDAIGEKERNPSPMLLVATG